MDNNEMFSITYDGDKYEIPKSDIVFENGYGVVSIETTNKSYNGLSWYDTESYTLRGVVDQDYDAIFKLYKRNKKIQIFPEGNILVKVMFTNDDGDHSYTRYETHHYKINGKKAEKVCDLKFGDYEQVNDTTIKVNNDVFLSGFEALYDVTSGKYISEKFSIIKSFEKMPENSEEEFAQAIIILNHEKEDECRVSCYIDKKGLIRTKLCVLNDGSLIDTDSVDFNFDTAMQGIRIKMEERTLQTKIAMSNLKRQLIPKKRDQ